MRKIVSNITELIGSTPLLSLEKWSQSHQLSNPILAKLEAFNPSGSVKDRAALNMIIDAEKKGLLKPNATIIEPTSGNTGIGLAMVCAVKGYSLILTMPETMSKERMDLLRAYGAKIVLTPGKDQMTGAIKEAQKIETETSNSLILGQFDNPANPEAHQTTAKEIWEDTNGEIDFFVAGVGTAGTLCGAGKYLKQYNPAIQIVAVEPEASAVLQGKSAQKHFLQGIGAGFIPQNYDTSLVDQIIGVSAEDSKQLAHELVKEEGVLVGISSGSALAGALQIAKENPGKKIVTLFPDSGEKYLSTYLFQ